MDNYLKSKMFYIFDWNGTLIADTVPSLKASNICLGYYNRKPITMGFFREVFDFPIVRFYEACGVSEAEMMQHAQESNVLFQAEYERLAARVRTRQGVRALLENLKGRGIPCIILSNYLTEKIEAHLKRLGLEEYFDFVSAHDCDGTTILRNTTKVERLRRYMEAHGFKAEDSVIIGDSLEEPEIARQLGLTSVGITDGYISRARLRAAEPDLIVHDLRALMQL